ncbi:MAG: HAMP domain-containing sensor histidine kinase, partial [Bdellovibrionales bacterium]
LIIYFKERVLYFSVITLFSILLFAFLLTTMVFRQLFNPLKDLSLKMDDFIQNKYSYKFTVPKMNEVGELQNTFNSLAQKVLVQIDDLKKLDVAKSEFLSIASHELRTPLTSIKGSLSLLNTGVAGQVTEVAKNLMNIALNETDRLIRLINELLDLAKIEARQFPLNHSWFSANQLVKNTFLSLQGFCTTAQVRLSSDIDEHLELYIDADRIQQVLTNLISNAVKFSPKGEVVEVKIQEMTAGGVSIEVHDHGKGIAPEDQEIIFEKFRQASNAQNPLVKGTGLGLAIAKSLVEQHDGSIGVRSTPGSGSVFSFTLPKYRKTSQKLSDAS